MKTKLSQIKSLMERKKFIEEETGRSLTNTHDATVDDENSIKIENYIGSVPVPVGIAGPILINSKNKRRKIYLPLATTEGALVASVSRGAKAVTEAGGVNVLINHVGPSRSPVFFVDNLSQNEELCQWIELHKDQIISEAERTSSHIRLLDIQISKLSQYIFLRLVFDTDKAMGMNMVTIAAEKVVSFIEKETKFRCITIAGNHDIDKKPAWLNFIKGRGHQAWAEVILSETVIKDVLKTTAEAIYDVWISKCIYGSIMSGSLGFNAHFANIVAALFISTGQDTGHIVEGSLGITATKLLKDGGLYISVYMPAVMVGVVGGGTRYKTQAELLELLEVKNPTDLVEIVVSAVLAGELSLLASLAEGSLASSHQKLGR